MSCSVFIELRFWLLLLLSVVVSVGIYVALLLRQAVSSFTVLGLGLLLTAIAGLDVYLLQSVTHLATQAPAIADDAVYGSEVTMALYVLPVLVGGIGVDLLSHVWCAIWHWLSGGSAPHTEKIERPDLMWSPAFLLVKRRGAAQRHLNAAAQALGRPAHQCHQQHQHAKTQVDAYPQSNLRQGIASSRPVFCRHGPA